MGILILVLLVSNFRSCSNNKQVIKNYEIALDSIKYKISKNQYNENIQVAQSRAIQSNVSELKHLSKILGKQDSSLIRLAEVVGKNTTSATYYNTVTQVTDTVTSVDVIRDTIVTKDTIVVKETLKSTLSNRWYTANLSMNKDTALLDLSIYNPFQVSHKRVNKLFKAPHTIVEVRPLNPYSRITELKSYTIRDKVHSFELSPYTGFFMDNNRFNPYVGIEGNYFYKRFGVNVYAQAGNRFMYGVNFKYKLIKL